MGTATILLPILIELVVRGLVENNLNVTTNYSVTSFTMETIDFIKRIALWTEMHCILCQLSNYHVLDYDTLSALVMVHFLFHLWNGKNNSVFTIQYICLFLKMIKTYFFPFWCEGRCSFRISFRALLIWCGFTPVASCFFVTWRMGDKIRIRFWNIFVQTHFKQSLW